MSWLSSIDAALFRLINLSCSHPLLDRVMPWFAWNPVFVPALLVLAGLLVWKGGVRGRVFLVVLVVVLAAGDGLVINTIKHAVGRPRPWHALPDAHYLVGQGGSGSMPSSHTATWFAATALAWIYYRRSWYVLLPLAVVMGFSRIYVGAHYPSDVLAGAILGAGYAVAGLWTLNQLWRSLGRKWFPQWWRRLPSLVAPPPVLTAPVPKTDTHWLRLGYIFIAVTLFARIFYIKSGRIELSEDEAYQWVWSKHLALSYFSKPPGIAYTQWLGTHLFGDTLLGVRFFSPVMAAMLSMAMLRFMARVASARLAFALVMIVHATPLLAVGAVLMTIDPPLVLFWTLSMFAGWRAVQTGGTTRDWVWTGVWMGAASLFKYSALFLVPCWALYFCLWPPARMHLLRAGPWLALAVVLLCCAPVVVWNYQHDWITVRHVSENAGMDKKWEPTWRFFGEFTAGEFGLLHPVFSVAALWAAGAFWWSERRNALWRYFFAMGTPVLVGYWLYTFHSRVQLNWIAPAVVPMFCLMAVYWESRWRAGARAVQVWFASALALGFFLVILLHDTRLVTKISGRDLPPKLEPHRRVAAWSETARQVGEERNRLLREGREVFIIASHYGYTGQLSFWMPEAKAGVSERPLVYYQTATKPENQFYFWPGYREARRGQNAIFINECHEPTPPPAVVLGEFESVTDLGMFETLHRERPVRRFQLYACRNLR